MSLKLQPENDDLNAALDRRKKNDFLSPLARPVHCIKRRLHTPDFIRVRSTYNQAGEPCLTAANGDLGRLAIGEKLQSLYKLKKKKRLTNEHFGISFKRNRVCFIRRMSLCQFLSFNLFHFWLFTTFRYYQAFCFSYLQFWLEQYKDIKPISISK